MVNLVRERVGARGNVILNIDLKTACWIFFVLCKTATLYEINFDYKQMFEL